MDGAPEFVDAMIDPSLVGFSDPRAAYPGRTWSSSDAEIIRCTILRDGVRCRHWEGGRFFLATTQGESVAPPRSRRRR